MKILVASLCLFLAAGVNAETMPEAESDLISGAGIPIYPDADFVYGNHELGFRFATSDSPEEVRSWYVEQLGEWSLMNDFGLWALYDGPKGSSFGELMSNSWVTVVENEELPVWHSLGEGMTTEIVIYIVN